MFSQSSNNNLNPDEVINDILEGLLNHLEETPKYKNNPERLDLLKSGVSVLRNKFKLPDA